MMTAMLRSPITATLAICGWLLWLPLAFAQVTKPLGRAHAHNDYEHQRPLFDALDSGFTSVEADIFLVEGELLVAHYLKNTKPDRTLESLYLKPLYQRFLDNKGSIFPGGGPFTLLVDIKNNGQETYKVLQSQLSRYQEMLSVTEGGKHTPKAVTIIISGDRPVEAIKASHPRLVGIDGRLADLDHDEPASLYPLISDNWSLQFRNRGTEPMTPEEQLKLDSIVKKAHAQGRRVRFWATAESEQLWTVLFSSQVDLIGTDKLDRLSKFLREQR